MDTPNENATQVDATDPQKLPDGLPSSAAKPIEREEGEAKQEPQAGADAADPNAPTGEPQAGKPNDPEPQEPQETEFREPTLSDDIAALKEHLTRIVVDMAEMHSAVMRNGTEMCLSRAASEISAAAGWLDQALANEKAAN